MAESAIAECSIVRLDRILRERHPREAREIMEHFVNSFQLYNMYGYAPTQEELMDILILVQKSIVQYDAEDHRFHILKPSRAPRWLMAVVENQIKELCGRIEAGEDPF